MVSRELLTINKPTEVVVYLSQWISLKIQNTKRKPGRFVFRQAV